MLFAGAVQDIADQPAGEFAVLDLRDGAERARKPEAAVTGLPRRFCNVSMIDTARARGMRKEA